MKKLNCWEFTNKRCKDGEGPGQYQSMCPAASDTSCDGINGGKNAGRFCWTEFSTFCKDRSKGHYELQRQCEICDFFKHVKEQEGNNFVLDKGHQVMSDFEPKIIAFLCNWCSYGAADLAGVSRLKYPANIRVIRIPCTGRMNPEFIVNAFKKGVDGVWVSGCHPGDCHYISGNLVARRKFLIMKNLLEYIGIEEGRVHFSWISSSEGVTFAATADKVVKKIKELGPLRYMVKDSLTLTREII